MLFDKTFSQLTTTELFQIYRLRAAVFIVAQSRVVQDPDDVDLIARHIFIKDGDAIVAYAPVKRRRSTRSRRGFASWQKWRRG